MKNFSVASILIAGVTFAGAANAATIVQNQFFSFGEAEASITTGLTGVTSSTTNQQTISFASLSRFDTGLGTLNSVSFNVSWTGEVENTWRQLTSFTAHTVTQRSTVTFRADGSTDSVSAIAGGIPQIVPNQGILQLGASGALDIAGGGAFTETSAAFLALFSGPGSIASSIELENYIELTVTEGGAVTAATRGCPSSGSIVCGVNSGNVFPLIRGNLEITYDFTEASVAMSAPGGIALLTLGLIGMSATRRRRR